MFMRWKAVVYCLVMNCGLWVVGEKYEAGECCTSEEPLKRERGRGGLKEGRGGSKYY